MRVITGTARGRKLTAPEGIETRPTSDLVKESVFSIIQFEIEGASVLDIFAGSGQMGIEALSRGAKSCVFVDQSKASRSAIEKNLKNTGFLEQSKFIAMDAAAYLQNAQGPFDIAFFDPPYRKDYYEKLLSPLANIMRESGIIICETEISEKLPQSVGKLELHKEYRYGKTKITVYRQKTQD